MIALKSRESNLNISLLTVEKVLEQLKKSVG